MENPWEFAASIVPAPRGVVVIRTRRTPDTFVVSATNTEKGDPFSDDYYIVKGRGRRVTWRREVKKWEQVDTDI